jgi:hypothetical protein
VLRFKVWCDQRKKVIERTQKYAQKISQASSYDCLLKVLVLFTSWTSEFAQILVTTPLHLI